MAYVATHTAPDGPIRVGSVVVVSLGGATAAGTVVEDYGGIGVDGRRMVRVRLVLDEWSPPLDIDVPAAELTQVEADDPRYAVGR